MAKIGRLSIPTLSGGVRSTQTEAGRELYRRRGGITAVPTLADARKNTSQSSAVSSNPFLLGPIWRLALRMGGLPIKWYRIDGSNGQREEAPDHPGYELTRQPNAKITRNLMVAGTVASMFVHKQAFWLKERDDLTRVAGLWPIGGNEMTPVADARGLVREFKLHVDPDNPIPFENVLWFRLLPGFDDWLGAHSPFDALGKAAQFGGAALDAMIDLFDNGMLGRFYVNLHGKTLEEDVPGIDDATGNNAAATGFLDRLSIQLSAVRQDKFAAPVAEDGATFDTLGGAPNDEVMIRALELTEKVVTQAFGFPLDGDLKRFYAEAIQPVADAIEQEMERGLATEWPEDPAFPQFQFREVIKGDWREQIEGHARAVLTMLEKPNEGRKDLDLPPVPGGDQLFGPLNLIALDQLQAGGNRPPKDTQGGLGGGVNDGQDSTTSDQKEPVTSAASATILPFKKTPELASVRAAVRMRWDGQRKKVLAANQEAFARRARAVLKKEAQAVRRVVEGRGRSAKARAGDPGLPNVSELLGEVGSADADLQRYLEGFMQNTGEDGWTLAQDLVNAERSSVNEALARSYAERATVVSDRFAAARADQMQQLFESAVENGTTMRELANEISAVYGQFADNYIDGIGRTETAFAYERAALAAWGEAGITEMDYVNGGGPCTTGVCEEAEGGSPYTIGTAVGDVGYSFEGAEAPPLHPSCTCFVVPTIREGEAPPEGLEIPTAEEEPSTAIGTATDLDMASRQMSEAFPGVTADYATGSGQVMSVEATNAINEAMSALLAEYPEVREGFQFVGSAQGMVEETAKRMVASGVAESEIRARLMLSRSGLTLTADPGTYAYTVKGDWGRIFGDSFQFGEGSSIAFNERMFANLEQYIAKVRADVAAGWHPEGAFAEGSEVAGTVVHEFGHAVANVIATDRASWTQLLQATARALEVDPSALITKNRAFKLAAKRVSGYAAESVGELWGEAFAEYKLNANASEMVKKIGRAMEAALKTASRA